jgi:hypothetical protein
MAKKVPKKGAKRKTNAPGQYLGYSLQSTRFLVRLLQAKEGDHICLEVFEDVGVELASGKKIAEQSKSNITTNPLTDRSVGLWKTLRNWIDAVVGGEMIAADTYFALFVANPEIGTIAKAFHDATDLKSARKALEDAKKELGWGDGKTKIAEALKDHLDVVFKTKPDVVAEILCRFQVIQSEVDDPLDELRPLMLNKLVSEDACKDVINWAHGWVKEHIDRLIGKSKPARIAYSEFHDPLRNYVRVHDREDLLKSIAGKPSEEDVKRELAIRIYVRQARIINVDETDILTAVNDFLMSATDRTAWAEDGHVNPAAMDIYSEELSKTWKRKNETVSIAYSDKCETDRGRLLYNDCMGHTAKLQGLDTPEHFTRGSFHALADDREIGWHPNYKVELTRGEQAV